MSSPVRMLVTYRPKEGKSEQLKELIEKHGPVLRASGLITADPVQVFSAQDKRTGASYFIEMFSWRDGEASGLAHQTPEVMSVWEPMGPILEEIVLAKIDPIATA